MNPRNFRPVLSRLALTALLSLTVVACDDALESADDSEQLDDGGPSVISSEATAADPIALIAWVDLLVEDYSDDSALPDTVHDKNIVDDEEPGSFEKFFK